MTLSEDGVNVAVASAYAERIYFCLFDKDGKRELHRLALPGHEGDIHFGFIAGVRETAHYGLRAEGPWQPASAHRFDMSKLLVDPCATQLDRAFAYHPALCEHGRETKDFVPKAVVSAAMPAISRPRPRDPTWIYELPVKAFTKLHSSVSETRRGTISALIEPAILKHFKAIGVDTIELMPLMAWIDERHLHALKLANAWGYNPITFFAPDPRLAPGGFAEIRNVVEVLHANGIQVLLDVVLNHTGEGDAAGPTLSLRGLDNASYYAHVNGAPVNDTGCGNTVALNHPLVTAYALAALRHWVEATGIDGFRFDLATVMGRTVHGFSRDAPLLQSIIGDPVLSQCILIAEPWDMGPGGYQLGHFPTNWLEWNDRFRDDVRRFWRGDEFSANALATRLAGSSDIFAPKHKPSRSVNFVAAHDGFTLRDLVIFSVKDNFANGEGNRDGKPDEVTWPGGDVRALLATLFLSRGTPMLTAGDEFGRSQKGNNNAYAQDNETTWLDWAWADRSLIEFVGRLAALRASFPVITADHFLNGTSATAKTPPDAAWFDEQGLPFDWHNPRQRFLGLALAEGGTRIVIICNGSDEAIPLAFAPHTGSVWRRLFSSSSGEACPAQSVCLFREEKAA